MPDAVRLQHVPGRVHQDVEGQAGLLDVRADSLRGLCDDGDDLNAAFGVGVCVACQFTEPAAAVRSPGAAVECEQHRSLLEEVREGLQCSLLRWQLEWRGGAQRGGVRHQNSFTSTICPASTMSVWAAISMYPSACAMLVMSPEALNAGVADPSTIRIV